MGFRNNEDDFKLPHEFQKIKKLGQGAYGKVMQIIHLPTGREYGCKRFEYIFHDQQRARKLLRELRILKNLKHPCCNQLLCVIEPESIRSSKQSRDLDGFSSDDSCEESDTKTDFDDAYLVLRLADTDLKKLLKSERHLEEVQVKSIVYDILCGLKYLHNKRIIHRDLKPANILLNNNCTIQICDFGLARSLDGVFKRSKEDDITLGHDTDN